MRPRGKERSAVFPAGGHRSSGHSRDVAPGVLSSPPRLRQSTPRADCHTTMSRGVGADRSSRADASLQYPVRSLLRAPVRGCCVRIVREHRGVTDDHLTFYRPSQMKLCDDILQRAPILSPAEISTKVPVRLSSVAMQPCRLAPDAGYEHRDQAGGVIGIIVSKGHRKALQGQARWLRRNAGETRCGLVELMQQRVPSQYEPKPPANRRSAQR